MKQTELGKQSNGKGWEGVLLWVTEKNGNAEVEIENGEEIGTDWVEMN
jgi:hypothetical protein